VSPTCIFLAVQAPAREGLANQAIKEFLGNILQIPSSDIKITIGEWNSNEKIAVFP
jgi:uncharacterized protein YggU (UPF0235/DUF167 family)